MKIFKSSSKSAELNALLYLSEDNFSLERKKGEELEARLQWLSRRRGEGGRNADAYHNGNMQIWAMEGIQ